MIIISRSLSRWHSFGSISNASTTWGRSSADGIHTITIRANEAKTQEEEKEIQTAEVQEMCQGCDSRP